MLEKFADFYEKEIEQYEGGLEREILNTIEMRRFVFEVCKNCVEFENRPLQPHNNESDSIDNDYKELFDILVNK